MGRRFRTVKRESKNLFRETCFQISLNENMKSVLIETGNLMEWKFKISLNGIAESY